LGAQASRLSRGHRPPARPPAHAGQAGRLRSQGGFGKAPKATMRYWLLDKIRSYKPEVELSAVKNVTMTEEYLADHFPEFPVLPGVFMLEAATQAGAWLLRLSENFAHSIISLKEARNVKYADFVAPGQSLDVTVSILKKDDRFSTMKVEGRIGDRPTLSGRIILERYNLALPQAKKFIGFANYGAVLSSPYWWHALYVTIVITVFSVAITLVLGFLLAFVLHRTIYTRGLVRTTSLIPYGIVTVAAAYSWQYAWTPGQGYLSSIFNNSAPLTNQFQAIVVIIIAEIWKTTPFMALLLLAGLSLVPEDLQKAAKVDGATGWQRFTKITLPLMKPAILVALLFRTLDSFRIFDNIYILTLGANGTGSVSILGYDNLFNALNLGIGSTISILIFICVAIIAFLFIKGFGTAAPGTDIGKR
jgi:multiple sugar transport system permease protein